MKRPELWRAPTFTNTEREISLALLHEARHVMARTIEDRNIFGRPSQICHAIHKAVVTQAQIDTEPKLYALIKSRLNGTPTLRLWLAARGYPVYANDAETFKRLQQTRLRWIDALIKELSTSRGKNERTSNRKNVPATKRRIRRIDWGDDAGQ